MGLALVIFFALVLSIYLFFEWRGKKKETNRLKLFLIPTLILCLFIGTKYYHLRLPMLAVLALLFSFLGDAFLIKNDKEICFRLGIFSFLMTQVLYGIILIGYIHEIPLIIAIVAGIYLKGIFMYIQEYTKRDAIRQFYFLYSIVFLILLMLAVIVFIQNPGKESFFIVLGAHLFALSDLLILKDLKHPVRWSPVILFYILGQMFINIGIILFENIF